MSDTDQRELEFCGLRIAHDERVLRPRPWTELQSRWAAELLLDGPAGRVLELCAGAGHIGLGTAALSGRSLVCVDVAAAAAELTTRNATANDLGDRVEVRQGRLEDVVGDEETFALVLADPPWVPSAAIGRFPDDPALAIDGGGDGLRLARACVAASQGHLAPGAPLLVQLGDEDQAGALAAWASSRHGWVRDRLRTGEGGVVLLLRHP